MAYIIDGKATSQNIKAEIKTEVAALKEKEIAVCLATVLVGADPASRSYVLGKIKTCEDLGIVSRHFSLPAETKEKELLELIDSLNQDRAINGILVQLPLPAHINESQIITAINPQKDVDGFHPLSVGRLVLGEDGFISCTPAGIIELLKRCNIETSGKKIVVVGRSNIVGKPLANLLMRKGEGGDATVTVCHSRTVNIKEHTLQADILIAAIGQAKFISADMLKDGAVVIDVGVNRIGQSPEGKNILVGDVDFEAVKEKASFITPVPGGVGPMTIAMLMQNTLKAAKQQNGLL